MQSQRSQKTDIFALSLLALVLLASLALFSYNPADPLPKLISPVGERLAGESIVFPVNAPQDFHQDLSSVLEGTWAHWPVLL